MADWKPKKFEVGDRVINSLHLDWGIGLVTNTLPMGAMKLRNGNILTYQTKTIGQRLSIRFSDGRTRTVITTSTQLKHSS